MLNRQSSHLVLAIVLLMVSFSRLVAAQVCSGSARFDGVQEQLDTTTDQIYFATNRSAVGNSYGYHQGPLQYGTISVSFIEPHLSNFFDRMSDPLEWKTAIPGVINEAAWKVQIAAQIKAPPVNPLRPKDSVIIYIHGFANNFHDAICRAAEIKHRARFEGAMVAFSWPASESLDLKTIPLAPVKYMEDSSNADASVASLVTFLKDLGQTLPPSHTVIVAHSMGSRLLVEALKQLPVDTHASYKAIVLLAPDVSKSEFLKGLPRLDKQGDRVATYVNTDDFALSVSSGLHLDQRAGGTDTIDPSGKMETIDITRATYDGGTALHHSDHLIGTALYDLFWNIIRNMPAKCRAQRGLGFQVGPYWELEPEDMPYDADALDPDCRIPGIAYH